MKTELDQKPFDWLLDMVVPFYGCLLGVLLFLGIARIFACN